MPPPWSLQRPGSPPNGKNRRYPCGPATESGGSALWSWSAVTAWSRPRCLALRVAPAEALAEDASGRDITKDAYAVASPNALEDGRGAGYTSRARGLAGTPFTISPHACPFAPISIPRGQRAPLALQATGGLAMGPVLARGILPPGKRLSETRSTVLTGKLRSSSSPPSASQPVLNFVPNGGGRSAWDTYCAGYNIKSNGADTDLAILDAHIIGINNVSIVVPGDYCLH